MEPQQTIQKKWLQINTSVMIQYRLLLRFGNSVNMRHHSAHSFLIQLLFGQQCLKSFVKNSSVQIFDWLDFVFLPPTGPWIPTRGAVLSRKSEKEILQIIFQHRLTNTCWAFLPAHMESCYFLYFNFIPHCSFIKKHVSDPTWFSSFIKTNTEFNSLLCDQTWGWYSVLPHQLNLQVRK